MPEFDRSEYFGLLHILDSNALQDALPNCREGLARLIEVNRGPVFMAASVVRERLHLEVARVVREGGFRIDTPEHAAAQERARPLQERLDALMRRNDAYREVADRLNNARLQVEAAERLPLTFAGQALPNQEEIAALQRERDAQLLEYALEAFGTNPESFLQICRRQAEKNYKETHNDI